MWGTLTTPKHNLLRRLLDPESLQQPGRPLGTLGLVRPIAFCRKPVDSSIHPILCIARVPIGGFTWELLSHEFYQSLTVNPKQPYIPPPPHVPTLNLNAKEVGEVSYWSRKRIGTLFGAAPYGNVATSKRGARNAHPRPPILG